MQDPIDAVGPWTIKSCPTRTREAVIKAARQEGVTVGQWLEKRVDEWLAAGSPVVVGIANAPEPSTRVSDLVQLVDAVVKLTPLPDAPEVRTARSVVRANMQTLRPGRALTQLPAPGDSRAQAAE